MPRADSRAARANRVFCTDEKHIRTENAVMDKSKGGLDSFLSKIADCARTAFRPCTIGDPRGRAAVRASSSATACGILLRPPMSARGHCALARANHVFCTDEKHIRTENAVIDKSKG
jgi:hypothetical protein